MASSSKNKRAKRFSLKAPIQVEDRRTGYRFSATMHNYSDKGLYFEADYALRPERKVRIKAEDPKIVSKLRSRKGVVKWRKSLNSENSPHHYGTGIKYR
jgi:hypothetical protein